MGSGEFDGGGSVHWKIVHGDGEHGKAHQHGGNGKDKHPEKGAGGEFTVKLNGKTQFTAPVDSSRIEVLWDAPQSASRATAAPPARATARAQPARALTAKNASKATKRKRA
jgi:hypothetical protein